MPSWASSGNQLAVPPAVTPRLGAAVRIVWTAVTVVVVEAIVCGIALLPVTSLWSQTAAWTPSHTALRLAILSFAVVPSYVVFALLLMLVSAIAVRILRWHTPVGLETRVAEMEWPLLR